MSDNVVQFAPAQAVRTPINTFVRVGETHRNFQNLLAQGRLRSRRAVFEASRVERQADVIEAFKAEGGECVLDTCAAELSAPLKWQTHVKNAVWLPSPITRPLRTADFTDDTIASIAEFAVSNGFNAVLNPSHYLDTEGFDWLPDDLENCERLRRALDAAGGSDIAIDFPVIVNHTTLNNDGRIRAILDGLGATPCENIWLRLSGMGRDLGPNKTRRIVRSLYGMQNIGKPIVLDYAGGLSGLAPIVFGVSAGVATGILAQDQFDASGWDKQPKPRSDEEEFKRQTYIRVPILSRTLSKKEFIVLAEARGGKRLLLAPEQTGFRDVESLFSNYKEVAANEFSTSIEGLREVPNARRVDHFIERLVSPAIKTARQIQRLKPNEVRAAELEVDTASLIGRIARHAEILEKSSEALDRLRDEFGSNVHRPVACRFRGDSSKAPGQFGAGS